jgi:hypothetical protein
MKDVLALIGAVFVAVVVVVVGSLIPTLLWYTFDDKLAEIAGVPSLGTIHWLNMWGFTIFMVALFGGNTFSKGDND